jgi:hypothetical protein
MIVAVLAFAARVCCRDSTVEVPAGATQGQGEHNNACIPSPVSPSMFVCLELLRSWSDLLPYMHLELCTWRAAEEFHTAVNCDSDKLNTWESGKPCLGLLL